MNFFHQADYKLAKWLDKLSEKEYSQKNKKKSDSQSDTIIQDTTRQPSEEGLEKPIKELSKVEFQDEDSDKSKNTTEDSDSTKTETIEKEIDKLKKEIETLKEEAEDKALQNQINDLGKRIDEFNIPDQTDMNDSINQSASTIKFARRELRRIYQKKSAALTGNQVELIEQELRNQPEITYQEISKFLAKKIKAKELDIYSYLMNRGRGPFTHVDLNKID